LSSAQYLNNDRFYHIFLETFRNKNKSTMSGYPYGNPGGGYPPQYGGGNSGFQPPPPIPNYNDTQSCASLYGSAGPFDAYGGNQMPNQSYGGMGGGSNYPPPAAPYDPYGGNQMPNASYGMGGGSYPPPPQQQPGGKIDLKFIPIILIS
jgi:hypothetical protein